MDCLQETCSSKLALLYYTVRLLAIIIQSRLMLGMIVPLQTLQKAVKSRLKTRLQFHLAHKLGDEKKLMEYHQELEDVIEDQLSLASIHYLRSHYQEAIDIYKRILLDNRYRPSWISNARASKLHCAPVPILRFFLCLMYICVWACAHISACLNSCYVLCLYYLRFPFLFICFSLLSSVYFPSSQLPGWEREDQWSVSHKTASQKLVIFLRLWCFRIMYHICIYLVLLQAEEKYTLHWSVWCHDGIKFLHTNSLIFNPGKHTGHYIYHLLNIQQLCSFLTEYIYMFHMILTIRSDCFPKQH